MVSRRKTGSGTLGLSVSLAIFSLDVATALAAELVAVGRIAVIVEELGNKEAVADLGRRISLVAGLARIAIEEELAPFGLVAIDRLVIERIVLPVELVAAPCISSVEGQTERFAAVELEAEIF